MKMIFAALFCCTAALNAVTLDEKIGSLFIVGAYSCEADARLEEQTEPPTEYVERMIQQYHVGGILFKRSWDPLSLQYSSAHFQNLSASPLLMLQDQEWGLQMRHEKAPRFPKQITLAAIQDDELLYQFGRELARESRLVGMQSPLSPVADVNSNPENPIIGDRSFGDDPQRVARAALLVAKGLRDGGSIAVAKHFPGHGDTTNDSHTHLPTISRSEKEFRKIDLYPFQQLIQNGIPCIMSAHIMMPAFDSEHPCTLSKRVMTDLLQNELGFQGVIMTDDLIMKAVADRYPPEKAAVMALQAGCDLMLSTQKIPECIEAIKRAVQEGSLSEAAIDKKCEKVKKLKEWVARQKAVEDTPLFSEQAEALRHKLYRAAMTFINPSTIVGSACCLQIGGSHLSPFEEKMGLPRLYLPSESTPLEQKQLLQKLADYKTVIVSFQDITQERFRKKIGFWGIQPATCSFIEQLRTLPNHKIYVLFGSPYTVSLFQKSDSIVVAYENDPFAEEAAADVLQGKLVAKGKLPIQ